MEGQFSPLHVCLSNSQPLFLWESPPYHHSFAGVPAIYISLSFAGVPAIFKFQLRESPPIVGLHSFQFHQFHPNLISKDEENNWSSTIIHNFTFYHICTQSSFQFNLLTIILHNLCSSHMAHILTNKNTTSMAHLLINKNTKAIAHFTIYICLHSLKPTIHHTKHITHQEYKTQIP